LETSYAALRLIAGGMEKIKEIGQSAAKLPWCSKYAEQNVQRLDGNGSDKIQAYRDKIQAYRDKIQA
jgi:hypothetical protein